MMSDWRAYDRHSKKNDNLASRLRMGQLAREFAVVPLEWYASCRDPATLGACIALMSHGLSPRHRFAASPCLEQGGCWVASITGISIVRRAVLLLGGTSLSTALGLFETRRRALGFRADVHGGPLRDRRLRVDLSISDIQQRLSPVFVEAP